MQEKPEEKSEEAAPATSVDFTPATPAPAAEEKGGFDPTQCAPSRTRTRRPGLGV